MSRLLLAGRLSLSLHPSLSLPPSVAVVVSRCTNYSPNRYLPVIALYALTLYALDPLPPPNIAPLCRPLSPFTFLFPRSRHWRVCLLDCPVTLRVSTLSPLLSLSLVAVQQKRGQSLSPLVVDEVAVACLGSLAVAVGRERELSDHREPATTTADRRRQLSLLAMEKQ